jgi:hypothetical protein
LEHLTDVVVLEKGTAQTSPTTLHVDCTADGLEKRAAVPVFAGRQITLQSVRTCQQVFSAAFIGHIEAAYQDEALKNELCMPVPHPDTYIDYLLTSLADLQNQGLWAHDGALQAWLQRSRLDYLRQLPSLIEGDAEAAMRMAANAQAAAERLQRFLVERDTEVN